MNLSPAEVTKKIDETPYANRCSGIAAQFIFLNSAWGLKYYGKSHYRDNTYRIQQLLSEGGFAPKLGDKIDFSLNGYSYYGYFTEIVIDTLTQINNARSELGQDFWYNADNAVCKFEKSNRDIIQQKYGVRPCDVHSGNVGFDANSELKYIDFSHFLVPYKYNNEYEWRTLHDLVYSYDLERNRIGYLESQAAQAVTA